LPDLSEQRTFSTWPTGARMFIRHGPGFPGPCLHRERSDRQSGSARVGDAVEGAIPDAALIPGIVEEVVGRFRALAGARRVASSLNLDGASRRTTLGHD